MTRATRALATCILLSLWGCATTGLGTRPPSPGTQVGIASYYVSTRHGPRTASGTKYDDRALTAAHPTLPFGTRVRVTNLENKRSVVVKITDRGPFVEGRIVDVSRHAAHELGFIRNGTARVRIEVLPS